MNKSISFLGCGWLGMPLANHFLKEGFKVKASVRTKEKQESVTKYGIDCSLFELPGTIPEGFLESEILFINIPPGIRRKGEEYHKSQINSLIEQIDFSSYKQVVYINSTAMYPFGDHPLEEKEHNKEHILFKTEEKLRKACPHITILRTAGLVGKDRKIVNILSGRELKNGQSATNLIFKDDIIALCIKVIDQKITEDTFNLVADMHPKKIDLYTNWCKKLNLTPPTLASIANAKSKIISNEKIKRVLNYKFKYPDPMLFPVED